MNKRFEDLFRHLVHLPMVAAQMAAEEDTWGNLDQLEFCLHYPKVGVGTGTLCVYRKNTAPDAYALSPGAELNNRRIWFIANKDNDPKASPFYARYAIFTDAPNVVLVDLAKPLLSLKLEHLPPVAGFDQKDEEVAIQDTLF